MDAMKSFLARVLGSIGVGMNQEVMVGTAFALAVLVVAVALALSRRRDRLQQPLEALRQPRADASDAAAVHPQGATADAAAASDQLSGDPTGVDREQSDPGGKLGTLAADLSDTRKTLVASVPSTDAELMAVRRSVQNYQERVELLQATLASLKIEHLTLRKLLENCNAGVKGIEQLVAAIPTLRNEHASIRKQLAELNARFDAASEVLDDFLESEDPPTDR